MLNQLAEMAAQINHDIRHLSNHKYIAHQMALLYVRGLFYRQVCRLPAPSLTPAFQQCLAQAPGDLSDFRTQVEQHFPALKTATKVNTDALQPVLPRELAEWALAVTDAISNEVFSLAVPEFAAPMAKIMDAVHAAA